MVMVTGIICGVAVAAITTVGTEAADIIMDGTGADIADIHNMRQGRLDDGATLIFHRLLSSRQSACTAPSSVAAARAAAVRPPSVLSTRSAQLRILLAIYDEPVFLGPG
jgi:hypothetical protein